MSSYARWGAVCLLGLGLSRMVADLAGLREVAAVTAATGAAPAPRVFSAPRGLETFSSRFTITWSDRSSNPVAIDLTPQRYAGIKGPYNRRNVYGAIVAYGPILMTMPRMKPMFEAVASYALCGDRPLLRELGANLVDVTDPIILYVQPAHAVDSSLPLVLTVPCE